MMKDRFKFRAWYQPSWEEHRMLYKVEQTYDYMRGDPESIPSDCFGDVLEDNNFVVMQCTGLKDKNGKLIYEGDIVRDINIPSYFYIVVWFKGGFYLKSTVSNSFLVFDTTQQEVIGNIYENPELLGA